MSDFRFDVLPSHTKSAMERKAEQHRAWQRELDGAVCDGPARAIAPAECSQPALPTRTLADDQNQLSVTFDFFGERLPIGVMERCIAGCGALAGCRLLECWRDGALVAEEWSSDGCAPVPSTRAPQTPPPRRA